MQKKLVCNQYYIWKRESSSQKIDPKITIKKSIFSYPRNLLRIKYSDIHLKTQKLIANNILY